MDWKNQNKMNGILSNVQKGSRSDQNNNYLNDIEMFINGRKQVIQVFTGKTLNGKIKVILMQQTYKHQDQMIIINILHQNENQINQEE